MTGNGADGLAGLQRRVLTVPVDGVLHELLVKLSRVTRADGAWLGAAADAPRLTYGEVAPAMETAAAPVVTLHGDAGVLTAVRTRPEPFAPESLETVELLAELAAAALLAAETASLGQLSAVRAETLTRMHDSTSQLRAVIESSPLGVALVRANDFALLRSNDALLRLTGLPGRAMASMTVLDLVPLAEREEFRRWLRALEPATYGTAREMRLLKHDGEPLWTRVFGALVPGAKPEQIVVQVEDISAQVHAVQLLSRLANNDPLTGLANRHQVMRQLDSALSRDGSQEISLLYLDLDGFKEVNDTLGHSAGDELLINLADRLAASVRPRDVVGRLGGDEFVVVLDRVVDVAEVEQMAERIREAIDDDVQLSTGERVHVRASIGASTAQPGDSPTSLIQRADQCMYDEKRRHHLSAD